MKKTSSPKSDLHAGMVNRSPSGNSGMTPPKASVNDGARRSSVAATPATLGPRET